MRRLRSLFLIIVALCLPLQAAAAVAMPLCRHVQHAPAADTAAMEMHCHEAAAEPVTADAGLHDSALGCDNCEMCHFATAGFLPVGDTTAAMPMTSVFVASLAAVSPSFISDPPEQPPRR